MSQMRSYPTGGQYRDALYNTSLCFKDLALKGSVVDLDKLGMPKLISGNFASVFTVRNSANQKWAVKCFTRLVDHQEMRYRCISNALRPVGKPWRVEFDYLPEGVMCEGNWYPALKMEWVDAVELIPFVESHLGDPAGLAALAMKFARMVDDLGTLGLAHGDLQHGNLLVTSSGELKLIDYDGMYVPSLEKMGACEFGHADYQSPSRTLSTWGPYLDNFSAWVIYASLVALAIEPTLWTLVRSRDDESLLFKKADFVDQKASRAFQVLSQSQVPDLQAIGAGIKELWASDVRFIPALDPGALPTPSRRSAGTSQAAGSSANAGPPIPDWVTQMQSGRQSGVQSFNTDTTWITGHLPPLPLVEFQPSRVSVRLLGALLLVGIMASAVLAGLYLVPAIGAILMVGISIVMFVAVSIALFRRTTASRDKHSKVRILKERKAEVSDSMRIASRIERARRDVDDGEQKELARITKQGEKARSSEAKEIVEAGKRLEGQVGNLERSRQRLSKTEESEVGNSLRGLQSAHIDNYLRAHLVSSARIPGIGQGVVRSLAGYGIRSAADFTGIQYQTGPRGGQQVYIRTRRGAVHPSGVGEKKARDLEAWRLSIQSKARASQPNALPSPQLQAIRMRYTQQRQALVDQEQAARSEAVSEQTKIRTKWAITQADLSTKLADARQRFAHDRAQADSRLFGARKTADAAAWQRKLAEREMAAYQKVGYGQYLIGIFWR